MEGMNHFTKPFILLLFFSYLAFRVGHAQSFDFDSTSSKSVLFEIGAGYGIGDFSGSDPNVYAAETKGTFFGGRIGAISGNFSFGFDYVTGTSDYKSGGYVSITSRANEGNPLTAATVNLQATDYSDIEATNMGLFVGYRTEIGLRFFFTYLLKTEGKISSNTRTTVDLDINGAGVDQTTNGKLNLKIKGKGLKFGLGYMPIPFVSVNLEYQMITWNELTSEFVGASTTKQTLNDTETKAYALSLTFPFGI